MPQNKFAIYKIMKFPENTSYVHNRTNDGCIKVRHFEVRAFLRK